MAIHEARENNSPNINRLTHPEFVGTYDNPGPASFEMFLLNTYSYLPDHPVEAHARALARRSMRFNAVIRDRLGLASCSGRLIEGVSVSFTKTYFELDCQRTGIVRDDVHYVGEYDSAGQTYEGKYQIGGTKLSGPFTLRSTRLPTV